MITASFRHIRGIGPMRERQLWLQGVRGWDALPEGPLLSASLDARLRRGARESSLWLAEGDLDAFARALPCTEHWRLLPQLLGRPALDDAHGLGGLALLDVETAPTGPGAAGDVTVVGVLDRQGPRVFLHGRDLHEFEARARGWRALCTFNGLSFDVPVLRRAFPRWEPPAAHVDLRHLCARVGWKGGLKQIERRLGLFRPPELAELSGEDAIWLWEAQRRGDRTALRRLLAYNLADVAHLKPLAELAYNRALVRTGMPASALPVTERGGLAFDLQRAVEQALGGQG